MSKNNKGHPSIPYLHTFALVGENPAVLPETLPRSAPPPPPPFRPTLRGPPGVEQNITPPAATTTPDPDPSPPLGPLLWEGWVECAMGALPACRTLLAGVPPAELEGEMP